MGEIFKILKFPDTVMLVVFRGMFLPNFIKICQIRQIKEAGKDFSFLLCL